MQPVSSIPAAGHAHGGPFAPKPAQEQTPSDAALDAPGKSGHSTAAQARQILALQSSEADSGKQPFGRTVSQVARGLLSLDSVLALQAAAEGDAVAETGNGETPLVDAAGTGAADNESGATEDAGDAVGPTAATADPAIVADSSDALANALAELVADVADAADDDIDEDTANS